MKPMQALPSSVAAALSSVSIVCTCRPSSSSRKAMSPPLSHTAEPASQQIAPATGPSQPVMTATEGPGGSTVPSGKSNRCADEPSRSVQPPMSTGSVPRLAITARSSPTSGPGGLAITWSITTPVASPPQGRSLHRPLAPGPSLSGSSVDRFLMSQVGRKLACQHQTATSQFGVDHHIATVGIPQQPAVLVPVLTVGLRSRRQPLARPVPGERRRPDTHPAPGR